MGGREGRGFYARSPSLPRPTPFHSPLSLEGHLCWLQHSARQHQPPYATAAVASGCRPRCRNKQNNPPMSTDPRLSCGEISVFNFMTPTPPPPPLPSLCAHSCAPSPVVRGRHSMRCDVTRCLIGWPLQPRTRQRGPPGTVRGARAPRRGPRARALPQARGRVHRGANEGRRRGACVRVLLLSSSPRFAWLKGLARPVRPAGPLGAVSCPVSRVLGDCAVYRLWRPCLVLQSGCCQHVLRFFKKFTQMLL